MRAIWFDLKKKHPNRIVLVKDSSIGEWVTYGDDADILADGGFDGAGRLPNMDGIPAGSYIHVRSGYEDDALLVAKEAGLGLLLAEGGSSDNEQE